MEFSNRRFFYGVSGNGFCGRCITGSDNDEPNPAEYEEIPVEHPAVCENCGAGKYDGERYARIENMGRYEDTHS